MDVISLLWQLGILSAVLIFGIKLGLATGLANMSKRYLAMVTIGYGGGVLILTEISSFFTTQITDLIYTYNFEFFLIMAVIMILAGIFTIREYKVFEKEYYCCNLYGGCCTMSVLFRINYCKYYAGRTYCRTWADEFKCNCCGRFDADNFSDLLCFKLSCSVYQKALSYCAR